MERWSRDTTACLAQSNDSKQYHNAYDFCYWRRFTWDVWSQKATLSVCQEQSFEVSEIIQLTNFLISSGHSAITVLQFHCSECWIDQFSDRFYVRFLGE